MSEQEFDVEKALDDLFGTQAEFLQEITKDFHVIELNGDKG